MPYSFPLQVSPTIPQPLRRLADLAENFWFSWYPETGQLFRKLDSVLWRKVEGNPKLFLRCVDQGILDRAGADGAYLAEYDEVIAAFDAYLRAPGAAKLANLAADDLVAYFCAEFGLHESFPIYSGGLGVLAGDHCKTASDLELPFVAVGLLYRAGLLQAADRPQRPADPASTCRSSRARRRSRSRLDGAGRELRVNCPFPGARSSRCASGARPSAACRCCCSTPTSRRTRPRTADITHVLYGGDREHRASSGGRTRHRRRPRRCARSGSRRRSGTSTKAMPRSR